MCKYNDMIFISYFSDYLKISHKIYISTSMTTSLLLNLNFLARKKRVKIDLIVNKRAPTA